MRNLYKILYCLITFFVVASILAGGIASARALSLTRYPYIQNLTTTSVVVAWRTDVPASSVIYYDSVPAQNYTQYRFVVAADSLTTKHALTLTDLSHDTTYYYCVKSDEVILASGESFHTAKTTSNPKFAFGAISDISWIPKAVELAKSMDEAGVDLIIHCGDVVHERGEAKWWNRVFFEPFGEILKRAPFYVALGNHDLLTNSGQPFLDALYLPTNNLEGTERYYSFDYANAHFICLDVAGDVLADFGPGSAQYNWLVNDLENTKQFWKFAFFHFPPYTSGKKYYGKYLDVREALSPLFEKYGVDIVFNGHEDLYERTLPMRDYYEDSKGVIYIIVSAGGLMHESGPNRWTAFAYPEPELRCATIVNIDGPVLNLRTIKSDGPVIDSTTIDRSQEVADATEPK